MRFVITAVLAFLAAAPAFAWSDIDRMKLAGSLGSVLGSESACGLSFDQPAIETFIDNHVPADDIEFTSSLSLMTTGMEYQLREMSESAKTAHCRQTKRVAKSCGFVTD